MGAKKHVVIIGAGFAGVFAAQEIARKSKNIDVTLIDRNNFHTFTPLLYQVATCGLDPSSIAYPVRSIFRKTPQVHFLMGEVREIDYANKTLTVNSSDEEREINYDYLLVATGSVTNYFGMKSLEEHAFSLKDLDDSIKLRQHILKLFERAAWSTNTAETDALTTMVVVGGGPTGIETAGALFELYNHVLRHDYTGQDPKLRARVILLEAMDTLLGPYPERLQEAAAKQLDSLGVDVLLNAMVEEAAPDHIRLRDGRTIKTHTIVWSAGVKASPIAEMFDIELQRGGRLPVEPTMQVAERDGVYAAGDMVYLEDENGQPYPMLIPVAKQQGILAANNIMREMRGEALGTFTYKDRGIMATIGRSRAVAWIFNRIQVTGFIAWLSWLFLHLIVMMGFRNRLSVFVNWMWNYITYDRSVRIILNADKSNAEFPDTGKNKKETAEKTAA